MTAALEGGWVVSSTPRPHFTPGKDPAPILQEAGWATGPVWTEEKSRPHRDSIPDRPTRSQSLYRLSCRAHLYFIFFFFFLWRSGPTRAMASSFLRFLDHTQRRTTVGRTPLDEWSARRRDLYLTTHDTQNRQTHAPGGIRTHDLVSRAAVDLHLRQRGHWDRSFC